MFWRSDNVSSVSGVVFSFVSGVVFFRYRGSFFLVSGVLFFSVWDFRFFRTRNLVLGISDGTEKGASF